MHQYGKLREMWAREALKTKSIDDSGKDAESNAASAKEISDGHDRQEGYPLRHLRYEYRMHCIDYQRTPRCGSDVPFLAVHSIHLA